MPQLVELIKQLIEYLFGIPVTGPALVALAAFFTLIVNLLKQIKIDGKPIIPDGWGGYAVIVAEVLAVVVVAVTAYLGYDLTPIIGVLDIVGKLVIAVAALFGISLSVHTLGRKGNVPLFRPRK